MDSARWNRAARARRSPVGARETVPLARETIAFTSSCTRSTTNLCTSAESRRRSACLTFPETRRDAATLSLGAKKRIMRAKSQLGARVSIQEPFWEKAHRSPHVLCCASGKRPHGRYFFEVLRDRLHPPSCLRKCNKPKQLPAIAATPANNSTQRFSPQSIARQTRNINASRIGQVIAPFRNRNERVVRGLGASTKASRELAIEVKS